jgi:hypothetical protein
LVPRDGASGAFNFPSASSFPQRIILENTSRLEFTMNTTTTDGGRIRLGGGSRLPATSKITLGGGFRLPAATPVNGKITLGGGFRLPVAR